MSDQMGLGSKGGHKNIGGVIETIDSGIPTGGTPGESEMTWPHAVTVGGPESSIPIS